MNEWVLRIVLATDSEVGDASLDKMADLADERDATVALSDRHAGVVITMDVDGIGEVALQEAVDWALRLAAEAGGCAKAVPVDVRLVAADVYEAEALQPDIPALASAADAAAILGVSRQRIHQLLGSNSAFPQPVARVAAGPLWTRNAIEWFDSVWVRKAGRPARQRTSSPKDKVVQVTFGKAASTVVETVTRYLPPTETRADPRRTRLGAAMTKGNVHTVPHGDGWANKVEGSTRVSNTAETKAAAQAKGREMAVTRGVEHVIHKKDGSIGEKNTYPRSRDPRKSKG